MEKEGQATIKLLSPPLVLCNSLALENSVKRAVDISFRRAAKNCIIPLNGRLALKFDPGQPHKSDSLITVVLSACSTPL
ncbi:MAG: hypothetical protein JSV50_01505 [Desulfobacteraceae bacterium]|nr:MAG: hypothetical protein JSV50_01505 [Desulfobacteraceae bacterium]